MREPTEKVIGNHTYEITPLPAGLGMKVLTRVTKALAPALSKVQSLEGAAEALGAGLATAVANLNPDDLDTTCKDFARFTNVSNEKGGMVPLGPCFDLHFAGEYPALFAWLVACAEVNYGPLLEGLAGKVTVGPNALGTKGDVK